MDRDLQRRFAQALVDPELTLGLGAQEVLLNIHRNTVTVGLLDALRASYPVTRRLLGAEAFDAAALIHLRTHLPTTPVLIEWGHEFPQHLGGMNGMEDWLWVVDVARVESARRLAYHAADRYSDSSRSLLDGSKDAASQCFAFHPSTQLVASSSPALEIWLNQNGLGEAPSLDTWNEHTVLIWRHQEDIRARRLEESEQRIVSAADGNESASELLRAHPELVDEVADALDAGWLVLDSTST